MLLLLFFSFRLLWVIKGDRQQLAWCLNRCVYVEASCAKSSYQLQTAQEDQHASRRAAPHLLLLLPASAGLMMVVVGMRMWIIRIFFNPLKHNNQTCEASHPVADSVRIGTFTPRVKHGGCCAKTTEKGEGRLMYKGWIVPHQTFIYVFLAESVCDAQWN